MKVCYLINDKGDCTTASATQALLKKQDSYVLQFLVVVLVVVEDQLKGFVTQCELRTAKTAPSLGQLY